MIPNVNIPKPKGIQKYERVAVITWDEGVELIRSGLTHTLVNGHRVKLNSSRLRCFAEYGPQCSFDGCPYQGTYFAVERPEGTLGGYHLNLWGKTNDGGEVLFTHDHILARGLGGSDKLDNMQTMCCWHNWEKGEIEGQHAMKLWKQSKEDLNKVEYQMPGLRFTYVTANKKSIIVRRGIVKRKSFNFYLRSPLTWDTNHFLQIIWRHAGFRCSEVHLVNNDYVQPETGYLAHRYDLFFLIGDGIMTSKEVNDIMIKIELDIRAELDVVMNDTHMTAKGSKFYATSADHTITA